MVRDAIIFVNALSEGAEEMPRSMIRVGGLSVLERQLRQLGACGVHRVRLISHRFPEILHDKLKDLRQIPETEVLDGRYLADDLFGDEDHFLVVEEGILVDSRLITALAAELAEPAVALFPAEDVHYGAAEGLKIESGDETRLFASVARFTGAALKAAQRHPAFGSLPLRTLIEVAMKEGSAGVLDAASFAAYDPEVGRERAVFWRPITSNVEARRAAEVLLAETDHGAADVVARFITPILENLLVLRLAPLRPGRALAQLAVLALAVLTFLVLAGGRPGPGLALAMAMSVAFGGLQRMARFYLWRDRGILPDRLIENFSEYLFYFGLAAGLSAIPLGWSAWALALALVTLSWARERQIDYTTTHLGSNQWRVEEEGRSLSLLGAGRNMILWGLAPFALTGLWLQGLMLAVIYAAATLVLWQRHSFRLLKRARWEETE